MIDTLLPEQIGLLSTAGSTGQVGFTVTTTVLVDKTPQELIPRTV
jgi:hypothetical protein